MKQLTERRDEGKGTALFHTEVSEEVLHSAEDDLQVFQHLRISMKPDRMIGLNTNDRYRELIASNPSELAHYPGKSQQLLYPFCIMEAKKERKAPGNPNGLPITEASIDAEGASRISWSRARPTGMVPGKSG
jgi:hypothetical protein